MSDEERIWHVPSELMRAPDDGSFTVLSDEQLLGLARAHAFDEGIFESRTPFFALNRISNSKLDSYFTKMHDSTLRNFANDAKVGVTILASHQRMSLGVGRSITGEFIKGDLNDDKAPSQVFSYFYTIPGLRLASIATDDIIDGIRSGIIHDNSVGFRGGTHECSICKRDLWDWDCMHIPGMEYTDEKTKTSSTAFAWIKDARLSEYSVVYDGATPGAEIISAKAVQEADAGRLSPETARSIESQFRVRLPESATRKVFSGGPKVGDNETKTEERVVPAATPNPLSALLNDIRNEGESDAQAIQRIVSELPTLRKMADEGKTYRKDLVDQALAEGVRAQGPDFATETYTEILNKASLDAVKRMRDDWKAIADKNLGGPRQSVEEEEPKKIVEVKRDKIPASAHRV